MAWFHNGNLAKPSYLMAKQQSSLLTIAKSQISRRAEGQVHGWSAEAVGAEPRAQILWAAGGGGRRPRPRCWLLLQSCPPRSFSPLLASKQLEHKTPFPSFEDRIASHRISQIRSTAAVSGRCYSIQSGPGNLYYSFQSFLLRPPWIGGIAPNPWWMINFASVN